MTRTTDEWKQLLDGISPSQWEEGQMEVYARDDHGRSFVAATANNLHPDEPAGYQTQCDARLIAAAPEAVAEVIRLREELEELREKADRGVRLGRAFGVPSAVEVSFRNQIARILNPKETSK